jgi:hypothetical protein
MILGQTVVLAFLHQLDLLDFPTLVFAANEVQTLELAARMKWLPARTPVADARVVTLVNRPHRDHRSIPRFVPASHDGFM